MKMKFLKAGLASLALSLSLGQAAVVINVDINGSSTNTLVGQGAYSDPGNDVWNGFNLTTVYPSGVRSTGLLSDSTGASTGVQLTLTGILRTFNYTTYAGGAYATGNAMMDDIVFTNADDVSLGLNPLGVQFKFSGLTPGAAYTLYLYGDSGISPKTTSWNINSVFKTTTGRSTTFTGAYVEGSDYVVYDSVVADGSGNLSGYFKAGGVDGAMSGVQLIAVPEPQTWALGALGVSAVLFRLRRKSRAA